MLEIIVNYTTDFDTFQQDNTHDSLMEDHRCCLCTWTFCPSLTVLRYSPSVHSESAPHRTSVCSSSRRLSHALASSFSTAMQSMESRLPSERMPSTRLVSKIMRHYRRVSSTILFTELPCILYLAFRRLCRAICASKRVWASMQTSVRMLRSSSHRRMPSR